MIEEKIEIEKTENEDIFTNTKDLSNAIKKNITDIIIKPISNIDGIQTEIKNINTKLEKLVDYIKGFQGPKYRLQLALLILFPIFAILGFIGYYVRRDYIPLVSSLFTLFFTIPLLIIGGFECAYIFFQIDFCSVLGNSISSGIVPTDSKGLGYYISCPTKDVIRTISTSIYELSTSFDEIYNKLDQRLNEIQKENRTIIIPDDKRNIDALKNFSTNISGSNISDIKQLEVAASTLPNINRVLAGLLSMSQCRTAKNTINYIEEKFCAANTPYMAYNILFILIASIGTVVFGIGLNKLIIVMKKVYAHALRGKKEFNDDEDDDDEEEELKNKKKY